jgi:hypothetical protein
MVSQTEWEEGRAAKEWVDSEFTKTIKEYVELKPNSVTTEFLAVGTCVDYRCVPPEECKPNPDFETWRDRNPLL